MIHHRHHMQVALWSMRAPCTASAEAVTLRMRNGFLRIESLTLLLNALPR